MTKLFLPLLTSVTKHAKQFSTTAFSARVPSLTRIAQQQERLSLPQTTPKVEGVITDLGGTTLDRFCLAPTHAFIALMKKYGIKVSAQEVNQFMGHSKDKHLLLILNLPSVRSQWVELNGKEPDLADLKKLYEEFIPIQLENIKKYAVPTPGTLEAFAALHEGGVKIGSSTGYPTIIRDRLLEYAAKTGFKLDASVASDEVQNGKDRQKPYMIFRNMELLDIEDAFKLLKVDDTPSGIEEGHNAGTWTVGVIGSSNEIGVGSLEQWEELTPTGRWMCLERAKEKLGKVSPHYLMKTMAELPDVVKDINMRMANGEMPDTELMTQSGLRPYMRAKPF